MNITFYLTNDLRMTIMLEQRRISCLGFYNSNADYSLIQVEPYLI